MTVYVALLRAVNVGGHGKLAMRDLVKLCVDAGFADVRTYIASGNVVFRSDLSPVSAKAKLEMALRTFTGTEIPVMVREAAELDAVLRACPFQDARGSLVVVHFLDHPPSDEALAGATGRTDEITALGIREIYVHYPSGMGQSKLRIKEAEGGTSRNMNTVRRLVEMATD